VADKGNATQVANTAKLSSRSKAGCRFDRVVVRNGRRVLRAA
jgi:hypothetical protein